MVLLAAFSFLPFLSLHAQDNLPGGGQPAGQAPRGGQPGSPAGQPFGNNPASSAPAANDPAYMQQVSYSIGRDLGTRLREGGIAVDINSLMAGINDAISGAQPKWTDQQLEETMKRFEQEMRQKMMTRMQQQVAKNQQEGDNFLAQNARQQGVQTTPSGLQYRVLQQGRGASPTLADKVKCNYKGTLLNGTEFDNSARHGGPAEFGVSEVIEGWTEALQKMHVGDKWQLFIPAKLAYKNSPPPGTPIQPGSLLVFEIELLDILKK
jgi:FKBP-type peptidyl-prolyl cis-trans isomerase